MSLSSAFSVSALATSLQPRLPRVLQPLCSQASPDLPALEQTCQKVLSLTVGSATADRLSQLISRDPALTCKVLQVANSIAYSPQQPITSIPHAVTWLGHNTVRRLVDGAHLVEHLHHRPAHRQIVNGVLARALAASACAMELGMAIRYANQNQIFTCTLLYTVGDLAIANQSPEIFQSLRQLAFESDSPAARVAKEQALLGMPKLRLAQALAQMWSLPPDLVELFAAAPERLPLRWHTDHQKLRGIAEGASALIEASTGPARAADMDNLKQRLQFGLGLLDEPFADLIAHALHRSCQFVAHTSGLSLEGLDGIEMAAPSRSAESSHFFAAPSAERAPAAITTNPQDTLQALHLALDEAKDPIALLDMLVRRLHRDGGFGRVALALVQEKNRDELTGRLILGVKDPIPYLSTFSGSLEQDHPFFRPVIEGMEAVLVDDFTTPLGKPINPAFLHVWNPGSAIMAPLHLGARPIGLVLCDHGPVPHKVDPNDLRTFQLFYQPTIACLNRLAEVL
ncbi:MAG: HDOD domain-containing protein [Nitrospira sp.]|jgi:HD-like signal output (HDOD) protein|nr:HDOD domain-containing protein [Nitrospira sp.]